MKKVWMQLTQFSEFFITDFRLFKSFELSPSKQAKKQNCPRY
ncbi:hypothetical protein MADA3029_910031 [Vibrio nigripulchritudo MADA3029]|uniref:Uncharacterized protein n=1 Tax=Vibrio nigripulchritudo TaxID=28173 RepID=U4KDT6_9VIBR|nr:hypothetical protein VIBNIMADA3020_810032 [Vibrio nigripulchritudo MADA3020]CCN62031.1 hypothetical protein MADA3029_910031 [Vibrio nigripulchritudo MADA3029]CCN90019.1 hypothetical protein VIBNISFn27_690026 [Vibrio nigripulchritudo SFn27]CCN93363.1 hypothetical protein VIBNIENn2_20026 [Vibrio nigripulchritudo ENn2]CCO42207.1 hypothetical protein VIBNISFn135_780021 [Vibrio nigripulchritudo SFn135]CCO55258.1 hypothetical protein VIBNIWn13_80026 [Vibrio nigripulchritudo Wn13]CCO61168.1 hypot